MIYELKFFYWDEKMHLILLSIKLMKKIVRGRKDLLHLIRSFSGWNCLVGIG